MNNEHKIYIFITEKKMPKIGSINYKKVVIVTFMKYTIGNTYTLLKINLKYSYPATL